MIDIKSRGLAGVQAALADLQRMGSAIRGVDWVSAPRDGGGATNRQIAEYQADAGRNVIRPGGGQVAHVASVALKELSRRLKARIRRASLAPDTGVRSALRSFSPTARGSQARSWAAALLRAAIAAYARLAHEAVDGQRGIAGGGLAPLSPEYAARKQALRGHQRVLKDTGQLLAALSPLRARVAIRLRK